MPYHSIDEVPDWVRKRGSKAAKQWMAVFNKVHRESGSEDEAFRAAGGAIKNRRPSP